MENVLTLALWLLPVAGVFALSTQEFVEELKLKRRDEGKMTWNEGFTFVLKMCQTDVCGCDTDDSSRDDASEDDFAWSDDTHTKAPIFAAQKEEI